MTVSQCKERCDTEEGKLGTQRGSNWAPSIGRFASLDYQPFVTCTGFVHDNGTCYLLGLNDDEYDSLDAWEPVKYESRTSTILWGGG